MLQRQMHCVPPFRATWRSLTSCTKSACLAMGPSCSDQLFLLQRLTSCLSWSAFHLFCCTIVRSISSLMAICPRSTGPWRLHVPDPPSRPPQPRETFSSPRMRDMPIPSLRVSYERFSNLFQQLPNSRNRFVCARIRIAMVCLCSRLAAIK